MNILQILNISSIHKGFDLWILYFCLKFGKNGDLTDNPVTKIETSAIILSEVVVMINKTTFGSFIREKRIENGLTQKELAEILFLSESAISKWEMGE